MTDLVVLVADKNTEYAVHGLLARPRALRIHRVSADIRVHPERDPGCFCHGATFLGSLVQQYQYAMLMMDREGSGQEHRLSKTEMEESLEKELRRAGWSNRSAAIVLEPEIEVWMWNDSVHVEEVLGWKGHDPRLRDWLSANNWVERNNIKPNRPKEALESALRQIRRPRSSALYEAMASKVSLDRCVDPGFIKFKTTLRAWFPP